MGAALPNRSVARGDSRCPRRDATPDGPPFLIMPGSRVRVPPCYCLTFLARWRADSSTLAVGLAAELTLSDQLLCDLFDDQVNVVQIVGADRRVIVLFTRGDLPKRLL